MESFKSDLRRKETEISTLWDNVLGGRAHRQALLDERRIKAVERVWEAVSALAPYTAVSAQMATINFEVAAKRTPQEANLRKVFEVITSNVPDFKRLPHSANNERPFLSPLAWAYFSAYQTIVLSAFARAKVLEIGIEDAGELLNKQHITGLLKAVLPHHTRYIEETDPGAYHYLLDELEQKLLAELMKMLEGKDIDQASVEQSAEIMKAVKMVATESEKLLAKATSTQAAP